MQPTNLLQQSVKSFFRRCYELGNTPVFFPKKTEESPSGPHHRTARASRQQPTQETTTEFVLRGEVRPGQSTKYSIQGEDFEVLGSTWLIGVIEFGVIARVRGVIKPGLGKCAREVVIEG